MNNPVFPPATSITHVHLLACANTELSVRVPEGAAEIRILDAGCGNGQLIAYLHECLSALHPQWSFTICGFDVGDHGVQDTGFIAKAVEHLSGRIAGVDWAQRIHSIASAQPWPFPDGHFDLVISNQVLEHVHDHAGFFTQAHRVLKQGGTSLHLFPLSHCLHEGHLHLPVAHWIRSHDWSVGYIALLSRMGLGKYRAHRRAGGGTVEDYAQRHADYLHFWTNYLSEGEVYRFARRAGFRVSFRHSRHFYTQKLRSMLRLVPRRSYRRGRGGLRDSLMVKALRYLSSVTLGVEKENRY